MSLLIRVLRNDPYFLFRMGSTSETYWPSFRIANLREVNGPFGRGDRELVRLSW